MKLETLPDMASVVALTAARKGLMPGGMGWPEVEAGLVVPLAGITGWLEDGKPGLEVLPPELGQLALATSKLLAAGKRAATAWSTRLTNLVPRALTTASTKAWVDC